MYAPPSHAPPGHDGQRGAHGGSSTGGQGGPYSNPYGPHPYAPTTQPTPGQPLLNNGKMLVYPHDWPGCPKCDNTGYKYGDPNNACRSCWSKYSQKPNAILIASAGMRGAKILQRPLHTAGTSRPGLSHIPTGGPSNYGHMAPQQTGFAPPMHPPPLQHSVAQSHPPARPAVRRENNEEDLNEEGEAPPAYADVVASGPDGALPPQGRQDASDSTTHGQGSPSSMMANMNVGPRPVDNMSVMLPTSPGGHIHHPYGQAQQSPWLPQQYGGSPWGAPHILPFTVLPGGAMPPPHAIPVAPGDPRIGGQLCYKCGGSGIRDTLWLTQETCNRCNGIGRLLM